MTTGPPPHPPLRTRAQRLLIYADFLAAQRALNRVASGLWQRSGRKEVTLFCCTKRNNRNGFRATADHPLLLGRLLLVLDELSAFPGFRGRNGRLYILAFPLGKALAHKLWHDETLIFWLEMMLVRQKSNGRKSTDSRHICSMSRY